MIIEFAYLIVFNKPLWHKAWLSELHIYPVKSDWADVFWIPPIKQCHLLGPRKWFSSVAELAVLEWHPSWNSYGCHPYDSQNNCWSCRPQDRVAMVSFWCCISYCYWISFPVLPISYVFFSRYIIFFPFFIICLLELLI